MIRLSKSCISEKEKAAVALVLDRGYLGMGQDVKEFEEKLTDFFGRTTLCVASGTAALQLAIQACGIGTDDEVLVPSLTYVASFQAIAATGAKAIACDIVEETCMFDWKDAEKRITEKTKAIMIVHYCGGIGDIVGIHAFASKYKLRIIEDAAHAFGTVFQGKRIGSFGDISCFSFDGIKNITCGEGGCVVSDDEEIIRRIQDSRLLAVQKDTEKRFTGQRSWEFDVEEQGWRYHMSNIMAAIGLVQLNRFPEFATKRQAIAKRYDELFFGSKIIIPLERNYDEVVPHIYVVRIQNMKNRTALQEQMLAKGIQTGIHYQPNHILSFFKNETRAPLPVIDRVFPQLLTLPLHPDLSLIDVEFVCSELQKLVDAK